MTSALAYGRAIEGVDPTKVAVIGYCFGGTMALELARSGAEVNLTVPFHGGLATKQPAKRGAIHGTVLIHHGAADPFVKPKEVASLKQELASAEADWVFVEYADAVHAFSQIDSGTDPFRGVAYNQNADIRSWEMTLSYLKKLVST